MLVPSRPVVSLPNPVEGSANRNTQYAIRDTRYAIRDTVSHYTILSVNFQAKFFLDARFSFVGWAWIILQIIYPFAIDRGY